MTLPPPLTRKPKKGARQALAKSVHEPVRKSARAPKAKLQQQPPAIAQPKRPRRGGTDPGPRNVAARCAEPRPVHSAENRRRHPAEPALLVRRRAHALGARRLDARDHRARAAHLDQHGRRRHAPQRRRHPRDALAQGSRVGVHAVRQRAHHHHRCGRPQLHERPRRRRPVVLPAGPAALDPGPRPGRLRVPAGVRRRRLQRGQHLPAQRLDGAHAAGSAGQELRRAGVELRANAQSRPALHLRRQGPAAA